MAVGSVYRYFPDKDAILDTLWTRYLGEFGQLMDFLTEQAENEQWDDPVGLVIDAFADFYRGRPALRAIWFGSRLSDDALAADRQQDLAMAAGLQRLLVTQGIPVTERLPTQSFATVLICDALLKEAFRTNPEGDEPLLEETKAILRAYLASLIGTL